MRAKIKEEIQPLVFTLIFPLVCLVNGSLSRLNAEDSSEAVVIPSEAEESRVLHKT
jgi:hypothetical protein